MQNVSAYQRKAVHPTRETFEYERRAESGQGCFANIFKTIFSCFQDHSPSLKSMAELFSPDGDDTESYALQIMVLEDKLKLRDDVNTLFLNRIGAIKRQVSRYQQFYHFVLIHYPYVVDRYSNGQHPGSSL